MIERLQGQRAIAMRDVRLGHGRRGDRRPVVVALFQHISYWAAVERLYHALACRDDIEFVVVALDSPVDVRSGSTADFLVSQGVAPHDPAWLLENVDDVDLVLLDNPYDEVRPYQYQATQLAQQGIRLAAVPYGNNAIAGELMEKLLWDLPLQRFAWRYYLPERAQRGLFARHCATGDEPVRVLGSAKHDRIVDPRPGPVAKRLRMQAGSRPVVLYNPHFRVGAGGWSTFDRYIDPLLEHFSSRDDLVLVVRPHFRLFSTLIQLGAGVLESRLRDAAARQDNIIIDEAPDYVDAFAVADAMISDLSSLANEFHLTGKPLLYLHRADGPGPTAEDQCFQVVDRAGSWAEVETFLSDVASRSRGVVATSKARAGAAGRRLVDGLASQRIADDMASSLRRELGLAVRESDTELVTTSSTSLPAHAELVAAGAVHPSRPVVTSRLRPHSVPPPRGPVPGRGTGHLGATARREPVLTARQAIVVQSAARRRELEDSVVLTSFKGKGAGCNPAAIARELERSQHPSKRYWVVQDWDNPVPAGCQPLLLDSQEHHERIARARFVVDNETMPLALERRPGQLLLQTWHGTPLKKLRFDLHEVVPRSQSTLASLQRDAELWDVMLSPNPHTTEVLRRGFRFSGRILESGYPRNDVLADPGLRRQHGAAARAALGISGHSQVVLYAPTWRDDAMLSGRSGRQQVAQPSLDMDGLTSALGPDLVVLVRGHRFVGHLPESSGGPRVLDVSDYPDMADLLAAADVLVTDYSSSFFDFALTGRPMIFYAYDLDKYRDQVRGHYFPMEEVVPGPLVARPEEVTELLLDLPSWTPHFTDRYRTFVEDFAPWDDGGASRRVVEALFADS
ncbi:CDP-glycerol glycerophosphotransferase family protein [Quadrisphaera sp. KR29]|uniref:CDP-glycerol glycerophosphotransferase family protein n=1 Tax=Quadrisphaera sp. KR29 TaxID=3461391 RepID=UPI0040443E51